MRYSLKALRTEFPTDDACLDFIFSTRYPSLKGYYRIAGRKEYVNTEGHHISPLAGTIFHKSSTPLTLWFHALFLFYVSKNGISAAELSRQLGVGYKTAFRMGHQIRSVMKDEGLLSGIVEVDETYIGGKHKQRDKFKKKAAVMGMVERGGRIRTIVIAHRGTEVVIPTLLQNVKRGSELMTDEFRVYDKTPKVGYRRRSVKHGKGHYVRGDVHSNTVEGAWGLLKPSLTGTHRGVSKKYLQGYLDEHAWRYNRRQVDAFVELLSLASGTA